MLDSLRNAAKSWLVKGLMAVLVLSFALWGINDIFTNVSRGSLIEVGRTTVSEQEFQNALDRELQSMRQRTGQDFTREQARLFGFDQNLLRRFVSEAVLDEQARRMGLGRSDQAVVRTVLSATNLDANTLRERLADNRISEAQFLADERAASMRRQIIDGFSGDVAAPGVLVDAVHRFNAETRKVSYILFGPQSVGEIADPDQNALETFYNENKNSFRAPEFRTVSTIKLDLDTLAKSIEVSDEDARAAYDTQKDKYVTPERRAVDQIVFENEEQARAASERIKSGSVTFDALATERNLTPEQLSLGTLAKDGFVDNTVAEASFNLAENAVSEPVKTRFGTVLVRVRAIEAGSVKAFEEVRDTVKEALAKERAAQEVTEVYGRVDDERGGGASLDDIAARFKLPLQRYEMIDRQSKGPDGKPVAPPPDSNVISSAFETDPGVEANAVQIGNEGYIWYDVQKVTPERDRTLDEVREDAVRRWKEQETRKRVSDLAAAAQKEVEGGKALDALAGERSLEVKEAGPFRRTETPEPLSASSVSTVFATPQGGLGQAVAQDGTSRVLFRVGEVALPPLADDAREQTVTRVRDAVSDDLLGQYIGYLQNDIGVKINREMLARIFGQTS